MKGKLGTVLLPAVTGLTTAANDLLEASTHLGDGLQETDKKTHGFLGEAAKSAGKFYLVANPATVGWVALHELNKLLDDSTAKFTELDRVAKETIETTARAFDLNPLDVPDLGTRLGGKKGGPPAFGEPGFKPGGAPPVPVVPIELQNRWFDSDITRRLDKVQDIATIKGQIAALTEIAGLIQQRIAVTKDITRQLSLEDQLRAVARQKTSLGEQLLADAAEARRVAKARAEEAAAIRLQQRTARQFRELGLGPGGEPVTPGVENLKKRVASLSDRIADTKLDTPKLRTQLARFRKVLSEGLVPKDVRARIKEMLDDINQQLGQNAKEGGPLTKTTQLNTERILAGLGLGRDAERMIRARLSHFNTADTALQGAGAGSVNVMVPVTVTVDGKTIAKTSSKYQKRARQLNPSQRNGPNAGLIVS
jgi:hypothetical protein